MFVKKLVKRKIFGLPSILIAVFTFMLVGGLILLARPNDVSANSTYYALARSQYPNIVGTRLDSCSLCHTSSIPNLNPYGQAFLANGASQAALVAIQNLDSDGDSFTNIQEIMALTFPGDPNDHPAAPTATNTAVPTATNTSMPTATKTPAPTATNTSVATATNTSVPTATKTMMPTATGMPSATATEVPSATVSPTEGPSATATMVTTVTKTREPRPTRTQGPCGDEEDDHCQKTPGATPTVICQGGRDGRDGGNMPNRRGTPNPCLKGQGEDDMHSSKSGGVSNISFGNPGNPAVAARANTNSSIWDRFVNWLKSLFGG